MAPVAGGPPELGRQSNDFTAMNAAGTRVVVDDCDRPHPVLHGPGRCVGEDETMTREVGTLNGPGGESDFLITETGFGDGSSGRLMTAVAVGPVAAAGLVVLFGGYRRC
jgi:hypothetical protein